MYIAYTRSFLSLIAMKISPTSFNGEISLKSEEGASLSDLPLYTR